MQNEPIKTAAADTKECRVSLHLLLDSSQSVNEVNWRHQVESTAKALTNPQIIDAINHLGPVAVMAESFSTNTRVMVPWTLIRGGDDAADFATALRKAGVEYDNGGNTDIGGAMKEAIDSFPNSPCGARAEQIIDISTDGKNNGQSTEPMRDAAEKQMIRINAIAVGNEGKDIESNRKVLEDSVITRDGFAVDANWDHYETILRRKILIEMSSNQGNMR